MAAFTSVQAGDWSDPFTWGAGTPGSPAADQPANASFEAPGLSANSQTANPTITSWTCSANDSVYHGNGTTIFGNPAPPAGSQLVILRTAASSTGGATPGNISQSFTLAAGTYMVSVQSCKRSAGNNAQVLRIQVDGATVLEAAPAGTSFAQQTSALFVLGSGGSHTVAFRNTGTGDSDIYLDDVEILEVTAPTAVPANGDTWTNDHSLVVDVNTTVGSSPSDTTTVVGQINAPLTVAAGVTFVVRGNVVQEATGDDVTLAAGAVLEVDDTAAGSPTEYTWRKGNANNQRPVFTCNGTSGAPCEVRKNASGSRWSFTRSITSQGGDYTATWTTFRGVTLTGNAGDQFGASVSGTVFTDCFFDSAPVNILPGANSPFQFTRCLWLNTPAGPTGCLTANQGAVPTGWAPVLTDCGFDTGINVLTANLTASGCVFLGGVSWLSATTAVGTKAAGFDDCLCRLVNDTAARYGDWNESLWVGDGGNVYDGLGEYTSTGFDDLHWFSPQGVEPGIYAVTDCVIESFGSDGNGDIDYSPSSTNTSAFLRCIILPDPLAFGGVPIDPTHPAAGPGTLTTNNATGGSSTYDHCTFYLGSQGVCAVAELGNGAAGIIGSLRSNIFWNDPLMAGTGSFNKAVYQPTVPAGAVADMVDPDQCGWNCIWNLNPATAQTNAKPYYDTDFSSPSNNVGQNDVVGDPGFVDSTRNLATWVASLEATWGAAPSGNYSANASPSRTDYLAHGLYKLAVSTSRPSHPDADSRYVLADYLTYVRAGFAPANIALKDAGHDGVTIGAVEGTWSTPGGGAPMIAGMMALLGGVG